MLARCRDIVKELDDLRRQVETYWYTRARKCELRDRDKNTNYFHHKAKQRNKRNDIAGIEDNGGHWRTGEDEILNVVEEYFSQLFCFSNPSCFEHMLGSIAVVVSDEMNLVLDSPLRDEESRRLLLVCIRIKHQALMGCTSYSISAIGTLLARIYAENQSVFTPGRLITDNALVAFEIFHAMKRSREGRHETVTLI
ncbi:uncharacterized protein LOC141614414 [Silene latifolia]|uniref:uncharacterized protein LOC141614414 n=1 Tax=Silene latifolia TaxID=37657 RepID=UPI003D789E18